MRKTGEDKVSAVIKIYRISRFFYIHHLRIFAKVFYAINYLIFNCVIPPSADLGRGCNIAHGVGIVIHHEAIIGENTKIYQNVTIGSKGVHIGKNCYIGTGAVIMEDLGDNVQIGANAVVTKRIPSDSIAVGIPARVIEPKEKDIE